MNIHFPQAEMKSKGFSYILAALAVCLALFLILNIGRHSGLHLAVPSSTGQGAYTEKISMLVVVPAPVPPQEQVQVSMTSVPSATPAPSPRAVPAPTPDVP